MPFNGTATQRVRVNVTVTSGSFGGCNWPLQIRKASDDSIVFSTTSCTGSAVLGPVTLPTTQGYLVFIDPLGIATGTADVTLTEVP